MTSRLLLDTHIALWLESSPERLSLGTRALLDNCWRGGGTVYLSAVSVWEIAMLVDARRLIFHVPVESWVERFVDRPGVEAVPLALSAAAGAYPLRELEHRDPADRLLIATAIELGCPLVTYDERIRRFGERHGQQHGFAVAA